MSSSAAVAPPRAVLICRPNSHPFQDRTVGLDQSIKIGRSVARSRPNLTNAIFDCKVLSRNHALLWYETGKFYLQDTKSSNGTFINNQRLSKSSEESPPREVSSGDIVQFGVDVMEVTKKVTHGCIVATLQLFLPDGKEAKASSSTLLAEKASTTSVQEIYQLNQFIQEALHREQMIETKLVNLNKLMAATKEGVDTSWKALIEEDRLLTRVDILERQLEVSHKSMSEDKLRNEVVQLHEDKEKYQTIAKEILRKAMQEKMDSLMKFQDLEMSLSNGEQEKALLKDMCDRSAIELSDMAVKFEESQRRASELCSELSQSAEKYKEEVEELNRKLKDGESLVADRQKVIDALRATLDAQVSEKIRDAMSRSGDVEPSEGDSSGESLSLDKQLLALAPICEEMDTDTEYQYSQKWKYAMKNDELKDELKIVLREKLEIHERANVLLELFDNMKAVSNKVQVSEYLGDLIAKVDSEIRHFKQFTKITKEELDIVDDAYEFDNEKVEEVKESSPIRNRRITLTPRSGAAGLPANGEQLLDESRRTVNSLELQNGAVSAEIQDLTAKLADSTKQLDYYKVQAATLSEENSNLERRLALTEEEARSMEQRLNLSLLEMNAKELKGKGSEKTIKKLQDEVEALTKVLIEAAAAQPDYPSEPTPTPSPPAPAPPKADKVDLRKGGGRDTMDGTTQTHFFENDSTNRPTSHYSEHVISPPDGVNPTQFLSSKLLEAEEELAIYKEQYRQSSTECLRLERKLTEQSAQAKESNMGALRYVVPLLIFILAILIAFHPSSS